MAAREPLSSALLQSNVFRPNPANSATAPRVPSAYHSDVDRQPTRLPRLIAIFGSGETSPTMTSVHKQLTARVSHPRLNAVFLDPPFGFQPNADDIVARTVTYFRDHVGCEISLASYRHSGRATALET